MSELTLSLMRHLKAIGGAEMLPRLHHFSRPEFASRPPSFQKHWDYSVGVHENHGEENEHTRKRIEAAIRGRGRGLLWDAAIEDAWREFPIVTR